MFLDCMRTNVTPIFCLNYVTGTFWLFFVLSFLGWCDSFVSVVDCGCSVKGSSRRRLRASVLELVVYIIFFFFGVSLLTCSYCLTPVDDNVHFYIYIWIYLCFYYPFWKLACKYLLLISFLKNVLLFPLVLVLVSFACVPGVVDEGKEVKV